ncbi:hypothetical protein BLNAU_20550 [Blattamonas nauphoetae]|uniref:Protein kinase domain-containing protein n=1 Tax=Blattamonas nauphoetae TaxID=2049346 RepID=A0ABQ9WZJ5_9EUKA|nr:hypothetical protein BLNAU_20550 [Blattamonas nauphoetae]
MFPPLREVHSESLPSSQVQHRTRIDTATPRKRNMRSGTTSNFMFDVWNSTFSASGVHVLCDSDNDGFCLVSSSIVHFSSSSITSNGLSSPFTIEMCDWTNGGTTVEIILSSVTHNSKTDFLPPLSGLLHSSTSQSTESRQNILSVPPNAAHRISIFGTGLLFESGAISSGTGPLFSFGLTDHDSFLSALRNDVEMETSLSSSSFVNMTSTHFCSSTGQLFGSEVSQRVIGCSLSHSSNHNSGTGMLDANVGGNVVCVNSSFSHCIRQPNGAKDFTNENITQSVIGRLNNVTSSITSVSYTLCTFDTMTVAVGVTLHGGAAIFLLETSSSLTIKQCFFLKCSCTGSSDDGGAICVAYLATKQLPHSPITISNSAFVSCSSVGHGGAFGIIGTTMPIDLNCLQFRGCSSSSAPRANDVYFDGLTLSQITSEMIRFCDSTSGSDNVYFRTGDVLDSLLIPQISSTISITSLSIVISETQAVVTVSTESAIEGSMGILLDGSNVPRLVHVVFGSSSTPSSTAQATVSSGANGMLPNATYLPRSAAIVGHIVTLLSFVNKTETTLLNPNTTEIVVRGEDLMTGSYWMEVWRESTKWNISLEWEDSTTLKGTAALYPSDADGRLDWWTEYEVRKVLWKEGEQPEKDVACYGPIIFTTPDEPARIEGVDCDLNGGRDVAVVELRGVQLTSLGQTVVLLGDSGEISSSGPIFDVTSTQCFVSFLIGEEENNTHVVFGGRYRVVSVGSGDDEIVVNGNLFVDIPLAPTIAKIVVPPMISSSSFQLTVKGTALPSGSTFKIVLNSSHSISVTFSSETAGMSSPIAIGSAEQLKYDTEYALSSVTRKVDGKEDELIFFSVSSFKTPSGPTLSSLSCSLDPSDSNFFVLSLTTSLMPAEDFMLVVTNTESSSDIVSITVPSASLSSGSFRVEVYNKSDTIRYDSSYSVSSMRSSASSVVAVVSAPAFVTPGSPARIVEVESELGGESEKSAIVKISGISLVGGKTFTLTLSQIISENVFSEDEVEITGTLSGDLGSTSHTLTFLIFDNPDSPLTYGCSYRVTRFTVPGMPSKVNDKVNFSVPHEPSRIVSIESKKLNKDRTKMEVVMIGRALKSGLGKVGLLGEDGIIDSVNEVIVMNETHCTVDFLVGEEEGEGTVKFGEEYTLLRSASSANGFHVEPISVTVPFPPKVTKMDFSCSNSLNTTCRVSLTGTNLVVGSLVRVTLNSSLSFSASITTETEGLSEELRIGWSDSLQFDTKYTISSITALDGEGETLFGDEVSDTTGLSPTELFIFSDSGSSCDGSVFCGERSRACASIGVGWRIVEGVGIGRVSFGIIDSSSLASGIVVDCGMRVVVTNGSEAEPTLRIPSSSSSSSSSAWSNEDTTTLIVVRESFFEIRHVNVVIDSQPSLFNLVSSTDSTIVLKDASLHGTSQLSSSGDEDVCTWSTGVLILNNCVTTVQSTPFTQLSQGAINMKNGSLTVISSSFSSNSPNNPSIPSLRRNIHCTEGGIIEIESLNGGDGSKDHPSAWISSDDCTITGDEGIARAPFFVPSLNTDQTSAKQTSDKVVISLVGTLLIPCGLGIEIREWDEEEKEYGKSAIADLTELNTTVLTETGGSVELDVSDWKKELDWSLEWRGRVCFGKNETTPNEFVVKVSSATAKKAEALERVRKTLPWLIPLVVVVFCVFVIVVIVVCCRMHRKKNEAKSAKVKSEELDEQVVDEKDESMGIERMDGLNGEQIVAIRAKNTNDIIHPNMPTTIGTWQLGRSVDTRGDHQNEDKSQLIEIREAVRCDGMKTEVVSVTTNDTLFNRLHRQPERPLDKPRLVQMLTRGLAQLARQNAHMPLLTRLSPLWVFLDSDDTPLFQVKEVAKEAEPKVEPSAEFFRESYLASLSNHTLSSDDQGQDSSINKNSFLSQSALPSKLVKHDEGARWMAPEVVEKKGDVNESKAAVFSLGLILWEIETGCVPFAEQDGVNAQRQVGSGTLPGMETWTEEWKVSLIEKCLDLSPSDRPTLEWIVEHVNSHFGDGKGGTGHEPHGMES